MRKSASRAVITLFLLNFVAPSFVLSSLLHAQGSFYQGKSIRLVIGNQAGGQYDLWARLFANYMGKYVAGNPAIVAQNMPSAGSVIAANYLYTVAKPDGLTIGAL